MTLHYIIKRTPRPEPWSESEKIPWNDPEFSRRMLREHLDQSHNLASRKKEKIEKHLDWIHNSILKGKPSNVLDLACGPGFYTSGLFGDTPHVVMFESFWDAEKGVETIRYYIIDADKGSVSSIGQISQACSDEEYIEMLTNAGFTNVQFQPSLTGEDDADMEPLYVKTAEKPNVI
jgi:hypothetical protein